MPDFIAQSLNNPELADVEFVVFDDESGSERLVYAHRFVLAAACEHFYSQFTSGCAEAVGVGSRCRLMMPEWVEFRPLLWMLAYLYHGYDPRRALAIACRLEAEALGRALPRSMASGRAGRHKKLPRLSADQANDLCCLLHLSDFYNLEHLKEWTEDALWRMIDSDHPMDVMTVSMHAFYCNASQLEAICIHHMQLCYADIAGTAQWQALSPELREKVLGLERSAVSQEAEPQAPDATAS